MDSDIVQTFNKMLYSMYDAKPPISKQKIFDITKAAMNAVRHFKHVVLIIEKFLVKCRNEYKICGLYVIDSIVRQARKQYKYKDVFAPRFATNLQNTFINILTCDVGERPKAVRVINLWLANKIFDDDVIEPLLQHCRATGLEVDTEKVELIVKGEKANMQIYGAEVQNFVTSPIKKGLHLDHVKKLPKTPPKPRTPPMELRPLTPPIEELSFELENDRSLQDRDLLLLLESFEGELAKAAGSDKVLMSRIVKIVNDRITEKIEIERRRQGNIKNLLSREFDYSDEEDDDDNRMRVEGSFNLYSRENILSTAKSLFLDGSLSQDFQHLNQETFHRQRLRTPPLPQPGINNVPQPQHLFNFPLQSQFLPQPIGVPAPLTDSENVSSFHSYPMRHLLTPPGVEPSSSINIANNSLNKIDAFRNSDKGSRKRGKSRSTERDNDFREVRSSRHDVDDPRRRDRGNDDPRSRHGANNRDRRITYSSHSDRKQRRSRSPVASTHRDRDREHRDRGSSKSCDKEREKDRGDHRPVRDDEEKLREKERERRKNGLPTRPKDAHVLIASRTLWFGRIPANCSDADICDSVKNAGAPEKINIVAPRACAYVTMKERRAAFKIIYRLAKDLQVQKKTVKLSWATIQGLKDNESLMDYWDMDRGIALIPFSKLPEPLDPLLDGAYLDVDTLPSHLKPLYDSKGSKNRNALSLPFTPSQQSQIPLPSASEGSQLALPNFPSGGFPSVPNFPPGHMFNFQQQMSMPPPFGSALATPSLNSTNNAGTTPSVVTSTNQQQMAAPNMAGMGAFASFPPSGAPPFPPFGAPSAAAAAAFLSGASMTQFPLLGNAIMTPQIPKPTTPVVVAANTTSFTNNQYNNSSNAPGFNKNRGNFRFPNRGGTDFSGNRGRGGRGGFVNNNSGDFNQRGGFRGGQRGGGWSGGSRNRYQNNYDANLENASSSEGGSSGNYGNGYAGGAGDGQFGGNRFYSRGRGDRSFNSFKRSTASKCFGDENQSDHGQENSSDNKSYGISRFSYKNSDAEKSVFEKSADLSQGDKPLKSTEDFNNYNIGLLRAFASTAADAIPVLENDKHLSSGILLPNLSAISIPQLSAATISNLREIIDATSSAPNPSISSGKDFDNDVNVDEDSDEYDDNDDNYFRNFDIRQKKAEAECVSTTESIVKTVSQEEDHECQIEDEVSSTTFYDEQDPTSNFNGN